MTIEERQTLRDALLEGIPAEFTVTMEAVVTHDLDRIEPIIDAWLAAARGGSGGAVRHLASDLNGLAIDIFPDGDQMLVDGVLAAEPASYRFRFTMGRDRLRSLAEFLLERCSR